MDSQYAKWFAGIANEMDTKLDSFEVAALTSYFDGVIPLQDTALGLAALPSQGPPGTTRRYPQSTPSTLALPKIKGANEIIWPYERDVGFGENWRNDFNSLSAQHYRAKPLLQPICAQWINSNAFTARLIRAFIIDGYYWALLLSEESNVSAAAQYFILASKEFLYNPFRNADKQNNPWVTGWGNETQLWTGERGFNMERWNFWKSQWGALRVREELSDDAREAARRAEVAMDKAERQKER
ncbi:hypothetical protein MW887_001840 [Aspergillus wentii]|nr:hypothetical protein MW887_001840 [Aspergillus wentii]